MTTDAVTIAATLRRLAEAEEACPDSMPFHDQSELLERASLKDCLKCNGTGRVPLFRDAEGKALFRNDCYCLVAFQAAAAGNDVRLADVVCEPCKAGHSNNCEDCRNGWLPLDASKVHLETAFAAARSRGWWLAVVQSKAGAIVWVHLSDGKRRQENCADGHEVEAALLALVAALEART